MNAMFFKQSTDCSCKWHNSKQFWVGFILKSVFVCVRVNWHLWISLANTMWADGGCSISWFHRCFQMWLLFFFFFFLENLADVWVFLVFLNLNKDTSVGFYSWVTRFVFIGCSLKIPDVWLTNRRWWCGTAVHEDRGAGPLLSAVFWRASVGDNWTSACSWTCFCSHSSALTSVRTTCHTQCRRFNHRSHPDSCDPNHSHDTRVRAHTRWFQLCASSEISGGSKMQYGHGQ